MIVRSAINTQIKKDALMRGTLLAGLGMMILIGGSVFLSREQLNGFGFLLFAGGITLVTIGMLPYRRLMRQENSPDEIHVTEEKAWVYFQKGQKVLEIPEQIIDKVSYISKAPEYGICLMLKKNTTLKVKVFTNSWQASHLGCDLFFPYFTERSVSQLTHTKDD